MYRRSRQLFFGTASSQRIDCQDEQPPARTFTPQQQLAMLILRKSELSKVIVAKLHRSTVKASEDDFQFLITERLAKHNGMRRELLPIGKWLADRAARDLAKLLDIPLLRTNAVQPRGSYQRKWHTESFSQ